MTSPSDRCLTCGDAITVPVEDSLGQRFCSLRCRAASWEMVDDYLTAAREQRHDCERPGWAWRKPSTLTRLLGIACAIGWVALENWP